MGEYGASVGLRDIFHRHILLVAEGKQRKRKRTFERILSQRQKSFTRQQQDIRKKSGVYKRQTKKGFILPFAARFI